MSNESVLMVDDDPVILKFVSANLKARGYLVSTASDGESAIQAVEQVKPNLILLDLLMPGMDGYEVCRTIRQWSDIPIIVLTAIGESNTRYELFSLGANDFLTKPFVIADLLTRVRAQLNPDIRKPSPDEDYGVTEEDLWGDG